MPEPERAVFIRARFHDLDYGEIADDLGLNLADVEHLLSSAMRHLVAGR